MVNEIDKIIYNAIEEDIPKSDVASDILFDDKIIEAVLISDDYGIISGIEIMRKVLNIIDENVYIKVINFDGTFIEKDDIIAIISGNAKSIIKAEVIFLNIIRRMSGVATLTKSYVDALSNTNTKILDTRNTTPNFRALEKEAVKHGGGINHLSNLSNHAIIKNVHYEHSNGIVNAVRQVNELIDQSIRIQVHVSSFEQFLDAITTNCDIIVLDGLKTDQIMKCVSHNRNKILIANNTITLDNILSFAETKIDFINVEAITSNYKLFNVRLKYNN